MKVDALIEGYQRNGRCKKTALSQVITELFLFPFFAIISLSEAYL